MNCPKCHAALEEGYLKYGNIITVTQWVQGKFEKTFWFRQMPKTKQVKVTAHRCIECGYIELYAS